MMENVRDASKNSFEELNDTLDSTQNCSSRGMSVGINIIYYKSSRKYKW